MPFKRKNPGMLRGQGSFVKVESNEEECLFTSVSHHFLRTSLESFLENKYRTLSLNLNTYNVSQCTTNNFSTSLSGPYSRNMSDLVVGFRIRAIFT